MFGDSDRISFIHASMKPIKRVKLFSNKCKNGPSHVKMCLMPYANNKGADQPVHPWRLISTFVVRCLDSMICILALSKVSRF